MQFALEPGVVVAGKYRVERVLGQGGMGVVAAAHHIQLEQRVALKLMLPQAMGNPEAVTRFIREARAAARISSEHVARVFDVGALETGEPYIAMEYLEGQDIAQLLAAQRKLTPADAVEYVLQACEALAEAHAAGIVHRDLKPGNLFLVHRRDGQRLIKVLDFGISKMSGGGAQSDAPMTLTSALMGSPLYMSPEQMGSSKAVDARSDIWALGVVLYEMLSGQPPFDGETLPQVCTMVMTEQPPPLAQCAPGLPPALYEVVRRCLEKQPAARFQSVAQLAQALEPLASLRGRQSVERIARVQGLEASSRNELSGVPANAAPPRGPVDASMTVTGPGGANPWSALVVAQAATAPAPEPHPGTYAPWGETRPPPPKRRSAPLFAGLGLAGLGVGVALWLDQGGASRGAPDSTGPSAVPSSAAAAQSAPSLVVSSAALLPVPAPSASVSSGAPAVAAERPPVRRVAPPARRPSKAAAGAPAASPAAAVTNPGPAALSPPSPAATAAPAAAPTSTRSRL